MDIKNSRRHWWIAWPAIHGKAVNNCFFSWYCKSFPFTPKRFLIAQCGPKVAEASDPYVHHKKAWLWTPLLRHSETCKPLTCLTHVSTLSFPINSGIIKLHLFQRFCVGLLTLNVIMHLTMKCFLVISDLTSGHLTICFSFPIGK